MKIETITRTLFLGFDDCVYETEEEARLSFVEAKIVAILDGASYYREYDTKDGAKAILKNWEEISAMLVKE